MSQITAPTPDALITQEPDATYVGPYIHVLRWDLDRTEFAEHFGTLCAVLVTPSPAVRDAMSAAKVEVPDYLQFELVARGSELLTAGKLISRWSQVRLELRP